MTDGFAPAPILPEITVEELQRVDIRVGRILEVADITGSRKLMRLRVSFGSHERTVVAGIKSERPNPQVLVGVQALFVVNLPVRVMGGVRSEAMLFDLGYADGLTPCLAIPESAVPDGTRAG